MGSCHCLSSTTYKEQYLLKLFRGRCCCFEQTWTKCILTAELKKHTVHSWLYCSLALDVARAGPAYGKDKQKQWLHLDLSRVDYMTAEGWKDGGGNAKGEREKQRKNECIRWAETKERWSLAEPRGAPDPKWQNKFRSWRGLHTHHNFECVCLCLPAFFFYKPCKLPCLSISVQDHWCNQQACPFKAALCLNASLPALSVIQNTFLFFLFGCDCVISLTASF